MGEAAQKIGKQQNAERRRNDLPKKDKLNGEERMALEKLRREARQAGSFLSSGGKGGLPPSLCLYLLRLAKYRCKVCGELGTQENGGVGLHHKYQHITAPKERAKGILANEQGRRNDPAQMIAICNSCHDKIHQKDRAEFGGEDADQEMKGDQKN